MHHQGRLLSDVIFNVRAAWNLKRWNERTQADNTFLFWLQMIFVVNLRFLTFQNTSRLLHLLLCKTGLFTFHWIHVGVLKRLQLLLGFDLILGFLCLDRVKYLVHALQVASSSHEYLFTLICDISQLFLHREGVVLLVQPCQHNLKIQWLLQLLLVWDLKENYFWVFGDIEHLLHSLRLPSSKSHRVPFLRHGLKMGPKLLGVAVTRNIYYLYILALAVCLMIEQSHFVFCKL
jgi:hypothetical protein